jgi:hypothetical protein
MDRFSKPSACGLLCLLFCKHIEILVLCSSELQFKTVIIFHIIISTVVSEFRLDGIKIPSTLMTINVSGLKRGSQPCKLRHSQCCLSICIPSVSVNEFSFDHPTNIRCTADRHGTWRIKTNV